MSALGDHKKTLLHSAAFLGITAALFYPVVSNVRRVVNGSLDDSYTILWLMWWVKESLFDPNASIFYSPFIESPFGLEVTHSTFLNHLFALPLTLALGPVGSYNIMILGSFFLSALGMYLLVNEVTGCRAAAFFSGLAFSFSPFHTAFSATGGMDAAQVQYMPFTLLFLVRHEKRGGLKDLFLFMLFLLLSVFSFGYYGAIILTAVAAFYSYTRVLPQAFILFRDGRGPGLKKILLWASVTYILFVLAYNSFELVAWPVKTLVWLVPVVAAVSFAAGKEGRGRALLKELYGRFKSTEARQRYLAIGGAGALLALVGIFLVPVFHPNMREISSSYFVPAYSYFVPAPDHPLLGRFLPSYLIPRKDPIVGKMVHMGLLFTGLVTFAVVKTLKAVERDPVREAFVAVFFIGEALALPPAIRFGEFTLWGPVYFLHALVPPFVDIRRVVVLMLLAGSVLAGFGIKEILKMTPSRWVKGALYASFLAVLAVEFYPATDIRDTGRLPGAYSWLKQQSGDFTVAEYPLTSIYDSKRNEPFFGETIHGKRLLNPLGAVGHDPAPWNSALKTYIEKGGPANEIYSNTGNAASALSYLGVKYVLLRTDKVGNGVSLEVGKGLNVAASFPDSAVYEVTAPPATAFISFKDFYRSGFFLNYTEKTENGYSIKNPYYRPPESVLDKRSWLWMGKNASLKLTGLKKTEALYDLTFTARSRSAPARLLVKESGAVVYSATVGLVPGVYTVKGVRLAPLEVKVLELEIENEDALGAARGFLDPRAADEPVSYIGVAMRGAVLMEEPPVERPAGLLTPGLLDGLYGKSGIKKGS